MDGGKIDLSHLKGAVIIEHTSDVIAGNDDPKNWKGVQVKTVSSEGTKGIKGNVPDANAKRLQDRTSVALNHNRIASEKAMLVRELEGIRPGMQLDREVKLRSLQNSGEFQPLRADNTEGLLNQWKSIDDQPVINQSYLVSDAEYKACVEPELKKVKPGAASGFRQSLDLNKVRENVKNFNNRELTPLVVKTANKQPEDCGELHILGLDHPNLNSPLVYRQPAGEKTQFVMKHEGESFDKERSNMPSSVVSFEEISHFAKDILSGLELLHDRGLVHGKVCDQHIVLNKKPEHVSGKKFGKGMLTGFSSVRVSEQTSIDIKATARVLLDLVGCEFSGQEKISETEFKALRKQLRRDNGWSKQDARTFTKVLNKMLSDEKSARNVKLLLDVGGEITYPRYEEILPEQPVKRSKTARKSRPKTGRS
ncbi:hypothetical protein CI610_00308 [invertebrate metagenome]|uniref:Protein kinase domain-containing protein n=1 Tax=invertebrate metagenome TaxID=1711999 RepID=A0A2H9TBT9_9ZZZZ